MTTITQPKKSTRKTYQQPEIKNLGSIKKLTLKMGSNTDGLGGHI